MDKKIHTGVLREIVKDRAHLGEHWIPVPDLLRRLQLDEPLNEIRSDLADARLALEAGDVESVMDVLETTDTRLRRLTSSR